MPAKPTVQISFLGRGPAGGGDYHTASYCFADGQSIETSFFGYALAQRIRPSRVCVLGTSGSMWPVLVVLLELEPEGAFFDELIEACDHNAFSQVHLDRLNRLLEPAGWQGVLIPACRDLGEQVELLQILASLVAPGHRVVLDVTHGLRHLAMIALASALYLETVRQARVAALYYGAFELRDPKTRQVPVLRLDGLLRIARWAQAIARFDESGHYGALEQVLVEEGFLPAMAARLRKASFYERTAQYDRAIRELEVVWQALDRNPLGGVGALFEPRLRQAMDWIRSKQLLDHQRASARAALAAGDYVRAATSLYEAYITRLARPGEDPSNHYTREQIANQLRLGRRGNRAQREAAKLLTDIRNRLAHALAVKRHPELDRILSSETVLRRKLEELDEVLLGNPDETA